MSLHLLRSTLNRLQSTTPVAPQVRSVVLRDAFILIEQLINPNNVSLLVRTLLESSIWLESDKLSISYDVVGAARYLSSEKATNLCSRIRLAAKKASCQDWRKVVFLAAIIVSEIHDLDGGVPPWYSARGRYVQSFLSATNNASADVACDISTKAAILNTVSYVYPTLSPYQRTKFSTTTRLNCVEALFQSKMVLDYDSATVEAQRGFKDLGLLSRIVAAMIEDSNEEDHGHAFDVLLHGSRVITNPGFATSDIVRKSLFLSIITILQSLLSLTVRKKRRTKLDVASARSSLSILRNLQGVHFDNTVFDSWRFCFNISLDMLASADDSLALYLDAILVPSPLARNPLSSTINKQLFSKNKDEADVQWILMILEKSADRLQSPETPNRIFEYCFSRLRAALSVAENKETAQLLHSVLLSLFSTHVEQFHGNITNYLELVLISHQAMNDRQLTLIFTTLYRKSLLHASDREAEDPDRVLRLLRSSLRTRGASELNQRLLATYIEMLPIIPPTYLLINLRVVDEHLKHLGSPTDLSQRFLKICTTEMSSDRALICVRFLLHRSQELYDERAKL